MKSPEYSLRAAYNSPLNPLTPKRSDTKDSTTSSLTPTRPVSTPKLTLISTVSSLKRKRKFSLEPPGLGSSQYSLTDNLLFLPTKTTQPPTSDNTSSSNSNSNNNNPNNNNDNKSNVNAVNANAAVDSSQPTTVKVNEMLEKQLREKLEARQSQSQSQSQ
jgi:hypothetical protein